MFKKIASLSVAALFLLATTASAATVALQDDFNYGPTSVLSVGVQPNATFLAPIWTTTPSVDYLATGGRFGDLCRNTGGCLDLDGSTNSSGLLASTMSFAAGTYRISYHLLGSLRGTTETVLIGLGNWTTSVTLGSNDTSLVSNFQFTTTGGSLTFANQGGNNVGAVLTSVTLAAVPLPAGGLLLLSALAGFAALRRRRTA